MKIKLFITVVIITCLCLSACSDQSLSTSSSTNCSDSYESSNKIQKENGSNYMEQVERLGSLLRKDWKSAKDISVSDYVIWYGYKLQDSLSSLSQYLKDDQDGFFFPAEEFENEVTKYFNVSTDYLRSDSSIYLADEQLYRTPVALAPLSKLNFEIESIKEDETSTKIFVLLHFEGYDVHKILIIQNNASNVQYLSLLEE